MSRGPGVAQRYILEILQNFRVEILVVALANLRASGFRATDIAPTSERWRRELALRAAVDRCPGQATPAQIESMRRAAHRLAEMGLVYLEYEGNLIVGLEPRVPDSQVGAI